MDQWLPLATFAFVSSITPGPNNVMLSASGIAFGFRRTLPHIAGVWVGFVLLLAFCGAGVGVLIERSPVAGLALKVVGSAYLLYLAWAMRAAFEPRTGAGSGGPLRFHQAVGFQFVNPKAWLMGITAMAVFAPDTEPRWLAVASICAVFALVNLPCICSWAAMGAAVKPLLGNERNRRALSAVLAALMAYSIVAIWI